MPKLITASIVSCLFFAASLNGQTFDLVERSGITSGRIEARPGRLIVLENNGERIIYSRDRSYDTRGGHYRGYYNYALARILRFPADGSGAMQTADLDDPIPRYTITRRIVRRARGRRIGSPAYPGLNPIVVAPPILPYGYQPNALPYGPDPYVPVPYVPVPYHPGYLTPTPVQSVVIESRTIPKPALPPATVSLRNDGPRELSVALVDHQEPGRTQKLRLPAGTSTPVQLTRDAGSTRVEQVRTYTPAGDAITKEVKHDVRPQSRYELVVHEVRIQSVAIDRTPGGNNAIEDINFSGKGLGRFNLPPGPDLRSGTINVYQAARSKDNAQTIAPILATEDQSGPLDPLERAIIEAQRNQQR